MQPEELVGQTLGHYRILRPLGYGGSAAVFLAQDINLHREVAVKVFQPPEGDAQDFLRRFVREARVLAQLDHPHILPIYDYGEQDGRAFLVVPYMAGGSLREWLRGRGPVPVQEVMQLLGQALAALQYAHDRGLIHRDIKPGNMLFKAGGTLLLADFGLVKVTAARENMPFLGETRSVSINAITGTPEYMAPEQINGQVVPASDIYAMGVILYEMLTGVRPFTADTYMAVLMKQLYEQPQPPRSLNPHISPALAAVVMRALEKDPARRYQRPVGLRLALEQAIGAEQGETAISPSWPGAAPSSQSGASGDAPGAPPADARVDRSAPGWPLQQPAPVTPVVPLSLAAQQGVPINSASPTQASLPGSGAYATPARPAPGHGLRNLLLGVLILALVLATALGGVLYGREVFGPHSPGPITGTPHPGPGIQRSVVAGGGTPGGAVGSTPATVLPTLTNCPASGTARAAIMPPIEQGSDQNIVYIVNQGLPDNPGSGSVERYDVTTGAKSIGIASMPSTYIREAQVSQDGQWVLFSAKVAGRYELRMVRMDGQELQTLYCAPSNADIFGVQWSFNERSIMFDVGPHLPVVFLLDTLSGKLQQELTSSGITGYVAETWLDNTHAYMVTVLSDAETPPPSQTLYVLDTSKGANQQASNLQELATFSTTCGSFDSSYNSKQLIISTCPESQIGATGPSTITEQPATGGEATTITTIPQAVITIRSVTPTLFLLLAEAASGDIQQNGLWSMNTDGSGLARLTTDNDGTESLCPFTQYSWSNVSPDGSMYALQSYNPRTQMYGLAYGSLGGGALHQFVTMNGTQVRLAGWTNM